MDDKIFKKNRKNGENYSWFGDGCQGYWDFTKLIVTVGRYIVDRHPELKLDKK